MKSFFKENPTIVFGLGLPLLLVIVFLLVSGLPSIFVEPPQHNVIYATQYYNTQNGIQISVVDKKIQVFVHSNERNFQKPQLWMYNSKTGAIKEIPIILPFVKKPEESKADESKIKIASDAMTSIIVDVPELEDLIIDSSSIAPDGYEFNSEKSRYSRNVFGGLFHSSRSNDAASIIKDGRIIHLPINNGHRNYRNNAVFIGWVVSS